eukprot:m.238753 g.238753  ORF g.238753 m.238753 type:complete len:175 (+) comp54362_c0_seq5:46-570(+)
MGSWLRFAVAIACMIQFGTCAPCQEAQCDTSSSTENLCSHKNLQAVPTCIPLSATVIDIGFNQLTGLDSNSFSRFSNLTRLFIHNNPITFLDPSTFASLSALQVIWMNDLLINDFPTGIFTSCANLRELSDSSSLVFSSLCTNWRARIHAHSLLRMLKECCQTMRSHRSTALSS